MRVLAHLNLMRQPFKVLDRIFVEGLFFKSEPFLIFFDCDSEFLVYRRETFYAGFLINEDTEDAGRFLFFSFMVNYRRHKDRKAQRYGKAVRLGKALK
jgi:hypothetical protein